MKAIRMANRMIFQGNYDRDRDRDRDIEEEERKRQIAVLKMEKIDLQIEVLSFNSSVSNSPVSSPDNYNYYHNNQYQNQNHSFNIPAFSQGVASMSMPMYMNMQGAIAMHRPLSMSSPDNMTNEALMQQAAIKNPGAPMQQAGAPMQQAGAPMQQAGAPMQQAGVPVAATGLHQSAIAALQADIQQANLQITSMHKNLDTIKIQLSDQEKINKKLTDENDDNKKQLSDQQQLIDTLLEEFNKLRLEFADFKVANIFKKAQKVEVDNTLNVNNHRNEDDRDVRDVRYIRDEIDDRDDRDIRDDRDWDGQKYPERNEENTNGDGNRNGAWNEKENLEELKAGFKIEPKARSGIEPISEIEEVDFQEVKKESKNHKQEIVLDKISFFNTAFQADENGSNIRDCIEDMNTGRKISREESKTKKYVLIGNKKSKVSVIVKNKDYPSVDSSDFNGFDPNVNGDFNTVALKGLDAKSQHIKKDIYDAMSSIIPKLYFEEPENTRIVFCHIDQKTTFVRLTIANGYGRLAQDKIDEYIDEYHPYQPDEHKAPDFFD